jgi:hypothetical protein
MQLKSLESGHSCNERRGMACSDLDERLSWISWSLAKVIFTFFWLMFNTGWSSFVRSQEMVDAQRCIEVHLAI